MKTKMILAAAVAVLGFAACQKANDSNGNTSLTASTTTAVVGQTVTVTLSSDKAASSWTVTPAADVTQSYSVTTGRVNYFTFSQPGTYRVGVRTRDIPFDSLHHHPGDSPWRPYLDSCWHHGGGDHGGCKNGQDSASVSIKVSF